MSHPGRRVTLRRWYLLSWVTLPLASGLMGSGVAAQRITAGSPPVGTEILLLDQAYEIQGNTARAIRDQMLTFGPGGGFTSFRYRYEWNYQTRVVPLAGGIPSAKCRVDEFEMLFTVDAIYPRWNQPDEAPDELITAWNSFEELFVTRWEERRRFMLDFAWEASRRVRRLEEACGLINQLTNRLVRDIYAQADEAEREAIAEGERVRLRWPPEGYAGQLTDAVPQDPRGRLPPPEPAEVGLADAAASDIQRAGMIGIVAGLQREGELEYLEAAGFADSEEEEPLSADATFRFPAFAELVVSTLAADLEREGQVDLQAPLSTYLPGLDDGLGTVSLHHLLSHRSGIDNAAPSDRVWASPKDSVWLNILGELDDRAMFTNPGAVFSFSRYNYPLALKALERVMEDDLVTAAKLKIFQPLGMENTSMGDVVEGLPMVMTTAPDLLRFGSAIIEGEGGASPSLPTGSALAALFESGERGYYGGIWRDQVGGQPRISIMCAAGRSGDAAGIQIFPEAGAVFVLWSRAGSTDRVWPDATASFLLDRLGSNLGLGTELTEPQRVRSNGQFQKSHRPCEEPRWNSRRADDPGSPAPAGDWAGRYINGDRIFDLEDREGMLWTSGGMEFEVTHFTDDVYFTTMASQPIYLLRLKRDEAGRRYAVLGDRAYIHEDDRPEH